ncbi:hypothetical protein SPBRAN_1367 [uncultured Candidatus Thioglobus sp.]|nr:hypothetical protein SPBRAN_1367 [uncultured Candidatus Thioglobus sp.]
MIHTINISNETYNKLESLIQGFSDTPEKVINRLIDNFSPHQKPKNQNLKRRDYTKYIFNSHPYPKNRLVLMVLKQIVNDKQNMSFKELKSMFPKTIQGSFGVFDKFEEGSKAFNNQRRFFTKPEELIKLSDTNIAVCNQWGSGNIQKFINVAKKYNYKIDN